jgi:hypothetical protein
MCPPGGLLDGLASVSRLWNVFLTRNQLPGEFPQAFFTVPGLLLVDENNLLEPNYAFF